MKDIHMLIFLTQLGLSCAVPAAGFTLLGIWLHSRGWGKWTVWTGLILGLVCAVQSFRNSLKTMERMAGFPGKEIPPAASNDHK